MSFNDRFGITDFLPETDKQGVSLSIDDFDEVMAVLLLIPNKDQHDHDHIYIPLNKVADFKLFLSTLGQSKFESGRYQLFITHYDLKLNTVDLEVYTQYRGQRDFLYKMTIPRFVLVAMNAWMGELEKLSKVELSAKYQRDMGRK
jgi:hypothetical protein